MWADQRGRQLEEEGFLQRGGQNSLKDTQWREANKRQDVGE